MNATAITTTTPDCKGKFDRTARFYEKLARVYSTGQIEAAKASQLEEIAPNQNVLYCGVGGGEDAVLAAEKANVTCIDLSEQMLSRVERKLNKHGHRAQLIQGDVLQHQQTEHYDVVTANFFLNCFRPEPMQQMLAHLASLVRPGGKLLIADVAVPQGNWLYQAIHQCHNAVGITSFWLLGLVPLHGIYDYRGLFPEVGLVHSHTKTFRLAKIGPVAYEAITAVKPK